MKPGDLVFCRIEHDVQGVHCVTFLLQEVLEVDRHKQVSHVCHIGMAPQSSPNGPNSLAARFITRIVEYIPKDPNHKSGGLAYSAAILLARDKTFYISDEYQEVLAIVRALKRVRRK